MEIRQLEAFHLPQTDTFEVAFDAIRCDLLHQQRVVLGPSCDQADVAQIALVAGAGVRQFQELYRFQRVTSAATSDLGISVGQ